MSAECADSNLVPLPLTREEQWIVHAVLLDYVELAATAGADAADLSCELGVLAAIEEGELAFCPDELDRIRHEIAAASRALDTPERDREVAEDLVRRLDGVVNQRAA